jgi:hypothetical protein
LCILRHFDAEVSKKCPVCSEMTGRAELRRVAMWSDAAAAAGLPLPAPADGSAAPLDVFHGGEFCGREGRALPEIQLGSYFSFCYLAWESDADAGAGVGAGAGAGPGAGTVSPSGAARGPTSSARCAALRPLLVAAPSQSLSRLSTPAYGSREGAFARVSVMPAPAILADLAEASRCLERRRSALLGAWEAGRCAPSPGSGVSVKPAGYASVASGRAASTDVDVVVSATPYPPALQEELSLISEAVSVHADRAAWVRVQQALQTLQTPPPPVRARPSHPVPQPPPTPAPAPAAAKAASGGKAGERAARFTFRHSVFQSVSGLDVFLHPDCCAALDCLAWEEAPAEAAPAPASASLSAPAGASKAICGPVVGVERVMVTDKTRRLYGSVLQQLPLNAWATLVHVDMLEALWTVVNGNGSGDADTGPCSSRSRSCVSLPHRDRIARLLAGSPLVRAPELDRYVRRVSAKNRSAHRHASRGTEEQELEDFR